MTRFLLPLLAILALTAAPPAMAQTAGGTAAAASLAVDANAMSVEVENPPPRDYPHVGHRSPVTFEQAVNAWAGSRFALTGAGENTLRIAVREADIVEKVLPVKKGIAGWFRKDQSAEFTATLTLAVTLIDANGQPQGLAEARSMHSTTIAEGTTDAEKQAVWQEMVRRTLANLDRELEPRIREALAGRAR